MNRLVGVPVLAAALVASFAGRARAQVPADSARRDSAATRDTTQRPPTRADSSPVVRHLTALGASVRPGSALYHVFVVAPRPAAAPPRADSARGDSARAPAAAVPAAAVPDTAHPAVVPDSVHPPVAPDSAHPAPQAIAAAPAIDTTDLGTRSTTIAAGSYGGAPAWMLVSAGGRGVRASIDTLVLAQSDLRALHLGGTLGLTRIAAELPGDSVFAAMSDPMGRHSVIAAVPRDAILSVEMLAAFLQVAPLAAGWSDSVHVAVIAPPTVTVDSAVLAVIGEESAPTPLGPTPCWVVVLRSATAEARLWVSKDTRIVFRVEQALRSPAGATLEQVYAGGTIP